MIYPYFHSLLYSSEVETCKISLSVKLNILSPDISAKAKAFQPQLKLYLEKSAIIRFERCFDVLHKETKQFKKAAYNPCNNESA